MPAIKTVFQTVKNCFAFLFKALAALLVSLIAYLLLIKLTDGYGQGKLAAFFSIFTSGGIYYLYSKRNWVRSVNQTYTLGFLQLIFSLLVLYSIIPLAPDDKPVAAPDFAGIKTRYWDLKTGSHIAYYRIEARKGSLKKSMPVIFLHGGPGAYVRKIDADFFAKFADDGYDVYLYDQAGSGRSGLLPKSAYSHARNIADFSAIIEMIGAQQYIVIGQSYGGSLLADLCTDKKIAGRIAKAVYAEPGTTVPAAGPLVYSKWPNALSAGVSLPVRFFIGIIFNPRGNFTSQNEVINYLAAHSEVVQGLYRQSFPVKDSAKIVKVEPNVLNLSITGIIPPEVAAHNKNIGKEFPEFRISSMLMMGQSSYIERNAPLDLLKVNPNIERVQYLRNTGHILWNGLNGNNEQVKRVIDAFLNDQPPVLPNYPLRKDISRFLRQRD